MILLLSYQSATYLNPMSEYTNERLIRSVMDYMIGIKGKTALVTGASRGIGRAIAFSLAREGANIIVNYVRDKKSADFVVRKIIRENGNATAVRANVSSYEEVLAMKEEIDAITGNVDILVNNAGVHQHLKSWELKPNDWRRVIDINLTGVYNCCNIFVPGMIKNKWGRIVNISSLSAIAGTDHEVHYAASKGGVISSTRALALELAPYGIRVNCVAPGLVFTDMTKDSTKKEIEAAVARIPLGRMGKPEEVAEVVLFLCSDKSSFITGETINVNGGVWFT